jgi:methionyl-tRNA formyltransferase
LVRTIDSTQTPINVLREILGVLAKPPLSLDDAVANRFHGNRRIGLRQLEGAAGSGTGEVVAAVTRPDRPKGRDLKAQPPPVKTMAEEAGLRVLQPESARDPAFAAELAALRPEVIVVAAYGQILPQAVLDLPKFGCVNVHASLLPKYRGAAPIQWAILNNEPETGVTIMKMAAGLDTGDVLSQRATPIDPDETAATLHDRLAAMGGELLTATLPPTSRARSRRNRRTTRRQPTPERSPRRTGGWIGRAPRWNCGIESARLPRGPAPS